MQQHPYFLFYLKIYFVLVPVLFCNNNILEIFVGHLRGYLKWDTEQEQLEFLPCLDSDIDVSLSTTSNERIWTECNSSIR